MHGEAGGSLRGELREMAARSRRSGTRWNTIAVFRYCSSAFRAYRIRRARRAPTLRVARRLLDEHHRFLLRMQLERPDTLMRTPGSTSFDRKCATNSSASLEGMKRNAPTAAARTITSERTSGAAANRRSSIATKAKRAAG